MDDQGMYFLISPDVSGVLLLSGCQDLGMLQMHGQDLSSLLFFLFPVLRVLLWREPGAYRGELQRSRCEAEGYGARILPCQSREEEGLGSSGYCMASVEDGVLASRTGEMRATLQGWNKSNKVEQVYLYKLGFLIC